MKDKIKQRIIELEELKKNSYKMQMVQNVGMRKFSTNNTIIYTKIINELKSLLE